MRRTIEYVLPWFSKPRLPGHGQMKPEQLEIAQLKREVIKLKAGRNILEKAAAYFAQESS